MVRQVRLILARNRERPPRLTPVRLLVRVLGAYRRFEFRSPASPVARRGTVAFESWCPCLIAGWEHSGTDRWRRTESLRVEFSYPDPTMRRTLGITLGQPAFRCGGSLLSASSCGPVGEDILPEFCERGGGAQLAQANQGIYQSRRARLGGIAPAAGSCPRRRSVREPPPWNVSSGVGVLSVVPGGPDGVCGLSCGDFGDALVA